MIEGTVNAAYEAVVRLTIQGPTGAAREIDAVIDTGFNGFLTLPPELVAELSLPLEGIGRATLGDGSEATFPFYDVGVLWDGQMRNGLADAAGKRLRWWACRCSVATSSVSSWNLGGAGRCRVALGVGVCRLRRASSELRRGGAMGAPFCLRHLPPPEAGGEGSGG